MNTQSAIQRETNRRALEEVYRDFDPSSWADLHPHEALHLAGGLVADVAHALGFDARTLNLFSPRTNRHYPLIESRQRRGADSPRCIEIRVTDPCVLDVALDSFGESSERALEYKSPADE